MDVLNLVVALGSFLLGVAGTGFTAYVVARNKHSARIDTITEKLNEIALQEIAIAQAKEVGKLQAISKKIDCIVEEQKLITSVSEAAKIDVLTSKMEEVLEQQKHITLATETIKSDVENISWKKKENHTLRRQKIELLYIKLSDYTHIMAQHVYCSTFITEDSSIKNARDFYVLKSEISMLIELYFNQNNRLKDELLIFNQLHEQSNKFHHKGIGKFSFDDHSEHLSKQTAAIEALKHYLVQSMKIELGED